MVKVKMNVGDRINLLSIFPQKGNFALLKISREAIDIISFSDKDLETFSIKSTEKDGTLNWTWNLAGNEDSDIEIGARAFTMICDELETRSAVKKLEMNQFTLYEKFVNHEENEKKGNK